MRNCVLIIEHDPAVSRFMQLKLEEAGFTSMIDNTGETAVDLVGQKQADVVVLDPDEPMKDGHEILGKSAKSALFRLSICPPMPAWMPKWLR